MAGMKEIRGKIKSVQNTRKITKAMEMVAASKMRKAQERMRAARPYAEKIRNVAAHISHANPEYHHPFLIERDTVKRVGIIVVTTDKGLCGALNTNVLRMALNPFISDIGSLLPHVISGAAVVSIVMSLPTTGPMLLDALRSQDMFLAGSFLMFMAFLTVIGVFLSDLALAVLDPRIRLQAGRSE